MAIRNRILAALAVMALALPLSGCSIRAIHVIIPDFMSHQVEGVSVFRLDDTTGTPVAAGHIDVSGVQTLPDGSEMLHYQLVTPSGTVYGQIPAVVEEDPSNPDSVGFYLIVDPGAQAGWFKVSSFNAYGASPLSAEQTYLD
jgi:hypothetical protein